MFKVVGISGASFFFFRGGGEVPFYFVPGWIVRETSICFCFFFLRVLTVGPELPRFKYILRKGVRFLRINHGNSHLTKYYEAEAGVGRWYLKIYRDWDLYGCFLKWWYLQNTPKWSFLVGKPMVVGYHHFRKPPYGTPAKRNNTREEIHILHIIPWRFASDHVPFQMGDGCRWTSR